MGLVVDFGTFSGGPNPAVQTFCEPYTPNMTGADLLAAAVGTSNLRWASSGLLCGIEGFPAAPACGATAGNGYQYWAYWHGGSAWSYAQDGPATHRLSAGAVDGWHFVHGIASASDPAPDSPSTGPCPAPTPTTAASGPTPTTPQPGAASAPARTGTAPARSAGASTVTPSSPTATAPAASSTTASVAPTTSATARVDASRRSEALPSHGQIVARPSRGSPVGPILVGLVIVALVVASVIIRRRRRPGVSQTLIDPGDQAEVVTPGFLARHRHPAAWRSLHPGAWWLWAGGLALAAMHTTNVVVLGLIIAVVATVVSARRSDAPWARSFRFFVWMAVAVVVFRLVQQILIGDRLPGTVVFSLPSIACRRGRRG